MKNQYACDVGDYGKLGLLRHFANNGIKIGVNWYLTEDDGSNDGKHIGYLDKPAFRRCDPELFDALKDIVERNNRSVKSIEEKNLIPNADYYGHILKCKSLTPSKRTIERRLWFNNSKLLLSDAELIFADPDNGMRSRMTAGAKDSEKYVLPEEISELYFAGKNVVYYCHKGRRTYEAWDIAKTEIRSYIRDAKIIVLTYHRGTQRSFIFVVHPDEYERYLKIVTSFEYTRWRDSFTREPVDNVVPGMEITGELLSFSLNNGDILTISKQADGRVCSQLKSKPGVSKIITADQLAGYVAP